MPEPTDPLAAFLVAATVPRDAGHASGLLDEARSVLDAHPDLPGSSILAAAVLGDPNGVRDWISRDTAHATRKGGPHQWDPLTYLCFSRYLRLDGERSVGFVAAARALLDAGASASTGFFEPGHQPEPEWESALYGAAGVAHEPGLTRLLLEHGADPNDDEVAYHTPEGYDNRALELLVHSGKLSAESLSLMLVRKHDWHDRNGVAFLLDHGADPNLGRRRGFLPFHHAIARDNALEILELLLDHGADPSLLHEGLTVVARAARHGRGDLLASLERRGIPLALDGVDRLIAACARPDPATVRQLSEREPGLVAQVRRQDGELLARFAGVGNTDGIRLLLGLGVPVTATFRAGDGYWDLAPESHALHVAAWRARHETVKFLLDHGASVNATDGKGRTALMLALKACVDSYWSERRAPDSVRALLLAGASIAGIRTPTGYDEADALLRTHGARE